MAYAFATFVSCAALFQTVAIGASQPAVATKEDADRRVAHPAPAAAPAAVPQPAPVMPARVVRVIRIWNAPDE